MKKFTHSSPIGLSNHLLIFLVMLLASVAGFAQNVGINSTGVAPNSSAGLDVDFPDKGVLIPRVALTGTASFAPLTAHVAGMVVYNTATAGDVVPGFYYNNGTNWVSGFPAGSAVGNMIYWNGTSWVMIPVGLPGQFLQLNASSIPYWGGGAFATLTTNAVTAITATSATTGGNITADGGAAILTRGVCYNTAPNPTTANTIIVASPPTGIGAFTSNLTGLTRATTYYVRAYATNNSVVSYGNQQVFTTLPLAPTLTATTAATSITPTSAISGGTVSNDGGATITERGICYGTTSNPTTANTKVIDGAPGVGTFISNISGLTPNTLYYVRAYAINSAGTSYATQISFYALPTVTTAAVSNIGAIAATCGGNVTSTGTVSQRGVCWSTSTAPTVALSTKTFDGTAAGAFTSNITGLTPNTLYYVRAYATNSGGTSYGTELTFTTSAPTAPVISSTYAASSITSFSAISGGIITNDGGSPITHKGVCWSMSPGPVLGAGNFTDDGTGTASYSSYMTGLTQLTTYYVRAYATNLIGTSYGPVDVTFATCGTPIYTIGQSVAGGIVYYVDCTGQHGLIVATVDQGVGVQWGCSGIIVGASGTAIYTGLANTNAILAGCTTAGIAARVCADYAAGGLNLPGFTNWYLPSITELQLMAASGLVSPPSSLYTYWSSSESGATLASGWFFYGNYQQGAVKSYATQMAARAVRAF